MGAFCNQHNGYFPIVRNLTVDQLPARKANDVLGHVLGCGCKFGNKEFMKIQDTVNKIRAEFATLRRNVAEDERAKIAKTLAALDVKGEVS